MGYNGKGIYCNGWSGLCGDGGKGLCTWYLLCSECVETYKQEPLPIDDTAVSTFQFGVLVPISYDDSCVLKMLA